MAFTENLWAHFSISVALSQGEVMWAEAQGFIFWYFTVP